MKNIITENDIALDSCLRFIVKELEKRTDNLLENPSQENHDLMGKDLHAYGCIRTLAIRSKIDPRRYDEDIKNYLAKLKGKGIILT